jgi:DNA-binding NtrC family response regulator
MRHLSITDDALAVLMRYGWPGNVRQLQNALFRAAVLCEGNALTAADFPQIAQESTFAGAPTISTGRSTAPRSDEALPTAPGITLYDSDGNMRRSRRSRPTSSASPSAIIAAG